MAIPRTTLAELERHLHRHAGLELPEWVVESRCAARMKELGLDAAAYAALLGTKAGARERDALIEAVRVGETRFFRHSAHVEALLEVVVPTWRAQGIARPRIWSAGCASGEEPYTLALVLSQTLAPPIVPSILATDVSAEALEAARRGVYPKAMLDRIPEAWRSGVTASASTITVRKDVARLVTFEQGNLASLHQPSGFDLIWCRNVLIYFAKAAQERVLERLVASLHRGGFLFLGYSESLRDVPGLEPVSYADHVLYQKTDGAAKGQTKSRRMREPPTPSPAPSTSAPVKAPGRGEAVSSSKEASSPIPNSVEEKQGEGVASRVSRVLRVKVADPKLLATTIGNAIKAPGMRALTVDLDDAEFVGDEVAPVLRGLRSVADAAGVELRLRATRPGPKRWLRRHGLGGDG